MQIPASNTLYACTLFIMSLTGVQPALSQKLSKHQEDSIRSVVSDSLFPALVIKVASYTVTIDHTDFLIRRKFNITPISLNMPDIEKKVKGFKTRLQTRGNQMNLRSLNSSVIILDEISDKLTSYQKILSNFSNELTASNNEVKKIIHDPAIYSNVPDSILSEQLEDIRTEGRKIDTLQQITLKKVNLLRNKVSINLLQASDIISDMRYLTISFKLGIWDQEQPPLLKLKQDKFETNLIEAFGKALTRSWLIITIYLNGKWNVITVGLMCFILVLSWNLLNIRRVKKQEDMEAVLEPMRFLNNHVLIGSLMAFFSYLPFFFANPPMSFLHACETLRLLLLSFLIYPYLIKQYKILWVLLSLSWLYYALDDILLESAFGERWGLFFVGILLALICIKIIIGRNNIFTKISESTATRALAIFSLAQVLLSIIFNLTGRASLAKILGVSAVQCLVLGVSLKVFCTMVLEAIYLQSESFHESRFSEFINFKELQHRFLRVLWILSILVWAISLMRNLTLYDVMLDFFYSFFTKTRTIGSMVFTFESVAIFIFIIWLSSVISGAINFFFGNENLKVNNQTSRSRLGSMMLLIRLAIWALGFCIAVAAAGVPINKLSLMLGALGVGIGFGLQNIVNNLVSGVIIAFERPIQVGDLIEIGGKLGVVKEIGVRSSKINNNSGADIIVPNGDLLSQHLINWTMQDRNKQLEFTISIPYHEDVKKLTGLIKQKLDNNDEIMASHPPAIIVQEFGDKGIALKVIFWVEDLANAGSVRTKVMIDVYDVLNAEGVRFPVYKGQLADPNDPVS